MKNRLEKKRIVTELTSKICSTSNENADTISFTSFDGMAIEHFEHFQ